jgi:hypothetical protein
MLVHSIAVLKRHRTIRLFSSTPTEYWHRMLKLDIQHSFLGNKLTRPMFAQRGFAHVLLLQVLDMQLLADQKKITKKKKALQCGSDLIAFHCVLLAIWMGSMDCGYELRDSESHQKSL